MTAKSVLRWIWNLLLGRSNKPTTIPKDSIRESLETVVFVVVLVFMLKQFVVEAFVIPTGSMAETLYGTRKEVVCSSCGYPYQINSDCEDPSDGSRPRPIVGSCCPNCRHAMTFQPGQSPGSVSGDRVLVLKPIYHREPAKPGDVVVFKFPETPQTGFSAQNYIKRMWGVGGQTIAIHRGDLFVCDSIQYPPEDDKPSELWRLGYTHRNSDSALAIFEESRRAGFPESGTGFKLIRKSETLIAEMKRIVYDNEHQPSKGLKRWRAEEGWSPEAAERVFVHNGDQLSHLRYAHLVGPGGSPALVDNYLGYNTISIFDAARMAPISIDGGASGYSNSNYWVGDLILECEVQIESPDNQVSLWLSKGKNQFNAHFHKGQVSLRRTGPNGGELGTAATAMDKPGKYKLRFANVDCRLHVWVDERAVSFGSPVDYSPYPLKDDEYDPADTQHEGWITANDKDNPVSVGAIGRVTVSKLKIWRDTYFINRDYSPSGSDYSKYVDAYYVQPGHFLCLGDNSAHSRDSRSWGTVPERLMLGKAVVIFFPLDRIGRIR